MSVAVISLMKNETCDVVLAKPYYAYPGRKTVLSSNTIHLVNERFSEIVARILWEAIVGNTLLVHIILIVMCII